MNDYIKKKIIENNSLKINNFGQRYKSYAEATNEQSDNKKEKPKTKDKEQNSTKKTKNKKDTKDYKEGKNKKKDTKDTKLIEAMTEMVEISRKLASAIVDIIESDSESEALVKVKSVVKFIKSK